MARDRFAARLKAAANGTSAHKATPAHPLCGCQLWSGKAVRVTLPGDRSGVCRVHCSPKEYRLVLAATVGEEEASAILALLDYRATVVQPDALELGL